VPINRLNKRAVERHAALKKPGMFPDGGGLYLQITPLGSVSWILMYRIKPLRRKMGLGPFPLVSLEEARKRRDDARRRLLDGLDPLAHRRAHRAKQAGVVTFRQAARAYLEAPELEARGPKTLRQWRMTLLGETPEGEKTKLDYCAPITDLPVDAIDTASVLRALAPIWRRIPETGSKLRGRIEAVLDYARARGLGGDPEKPNPARWKGNLEFALAGGIAPVHHSAMPYADVPAFLARLQAADGTAAAALRLLILTATRTSEALGARWDEIDLEAKRWVIPAERMKTRQEHVVPLSEQAAELLRGIGRFEEFVFPGARAGRPLSDMAMAMTLRRLGATGFTVHGFRSAFRDWAADHGIEFEVAEACLAHQVGNSVTRAYLRSSMVARRRGVMEAWASFLAGETEGADNVVALRR
jgi:integrase